MRKMLLLVASFLLLSWQLSAQSRTISGKVTDAKSAPVPNVSVTVKGATSGTTSNEEGVYSITVPDNAKTLVFSAIGMASMEVAIGSQTNISVIMKPEEKQLQEVVVVGYGKTTKQAYTGSATVVKSERLENKSVANVSQALAGEVAGVRVINPSGQPGTEATIRIRGFGSVNGNRNPLYVVDGIPYTGSINAINMADVESTTVLKDATATAIYGARGANGVIVITTKSGKGKGFIEVDGSLSTNRSMIPRYKVIKNPEQYIALGWEGLVGEGELYGEADPIQYANDNIFGAAGLGSFYNMWKVTDGSQLIDPVTKQVRPGVERKYTPENWEDYAFSASNRQEVNLKMGGGDAKTSFYTGLGYLNDVGYSINTSYKRLSARLNVNHEIKKWLTGSMNLSYANSKRQSNGQGSNSNSVFWFVDNMPSIYPLFKKDKDGNNITEPQFGGFEYDYGGTRRRFAGQTNAIADANYDTHNDDRNELNGATALTLKFTKNLSFETRLGVQYYNNNFINRSNKYFGSSASQNGSIFSRKTELLNYNVLNMLRYSKSFGDHNFEALAAHENTDWKLVTTTLSKYNMVKNISEDFNNAVVTSPTTSFTEQYRLESYFGQINYDFKGTYYLSGSFRRDGSSRFRKNKWGNFGSIGAGWIVSNEDFMDKQNIFTYLKLKTSYGLVGDQAGVGYYPGYDLYNIDNLNDQPAFSFNSKGNPDLTWEKSKIFQVGTEFKIKKFLTGSLEYYIKNTDNLIFDRRVGPSIGYALTRINGGNLRNQGLEIDLTGHILQQKDYYVNLGVNAEIFKNKITEMPLDLTTGKEKTIDIQGRMGWGKGHSIYDYYMREFVGVDPADGSSTWTTFYNDANNNGKMDAGERIASLTQFNAENPDKADAIKKTTTKSYSQATQFYVGKSALPKIRGAVNLTAGYKGFDLAVQMLYSFGGYAYDDAYAGLMADGIVGENNWHEDMMKRWQKPNDITDVPRLTNGNNLNVVSTSTRFLTKANYLALNNIRLGYTFPASLISKLMLTDASVWISGDNLWLKTKRAGLNPATAENGGSDTYRYAPLSTLTVGLRVKF
ncbi:SusC/RagA family TonB-linked outer membrane protein [Pseudoflavitalea sp. G-6-1-2]|uniref:SusC/RagA family TonB-linked outer membrane protein n=1 Tax=Pseudoflavitalea sp. G-6-1-2 TaxID=2728841 RepID=UPI00146C1846|nr:SusC/RagA family TonB-linked outer membrane protein [Pseudoflavitalea sp. G-6-1-2]NML20397.1 SusC/RagA family TonB-linked outer membrane protein [Pseudoflavitalea sp. G-6-1-2]